MGPYLDLQFATSSVEESLSLAADVIARIGPSTDVKPHSGRRSWAARAPRWPGEMGRYWLFTRPTARGELATMPDDRDGSAPLTPWQAWLSMWGLRGPLSGDVTQDISPAIGGQLGLVNINATRSGDPALEQRIITEVASYGRQLGWLVDAVDVLVRCQPREHLTKADSHALDQLHKLAEQVAAVKKQAAVDRIDRIVADVQALSQDPEANAAAIQRVREALPER